METGLRRRSGLRKSETRTVNYYCRTQRRTFFHCEPMQERAIECRNPMCLDKYWSGTKGVLARGIRVMNRTTGMRIAGVVRALGGGIRRRNFNGVVFANQGGNRFATRKYCCAEPKNGPSYHQRHAREPMQTPRPSGPWHLGGPSHPRRHIWSELETARPSV